MHMPTITGIIRRRILANFSVEPEVIARLLPAPFSPKIVNGRAVAGVCLIRLEQIRPLHTPAALGITSENAAHRIAVTWQDKEGIEREGVYIPRRDTDSLLNVLAGGRLFPGAHHRADFEVADDGDTVDLTMRARDGGTQVAIHAAAAPGLASSLFASLDEASDFFARGSLGYSARSEPGCLDGITLHTGAWKVAPMRVDTIRSSFFDDETHFPPGTAKFDCALVMRDIPHEWHTEPTLTSSRAPAPRASGALR